MDGGEKVAIVGKTIFPKGFAVKGSRKWGSRWGRGLRVQWFYLCFGSFLRYNSHILPFTSVKYTAQWFLVFPQSCATTSTVNFGTFSWPPKEILVPLAVTTHFPNSFIPRQPRIFFLSLHICLFRHFIWMEWNVAFCVWFLRTGHDLQVSSTL